MQNLKLEKSFEINSKAEEISPLLDKIISELDKKTDIRNELKFDLELAAREMLANAIEHGCALASKNKEINNSLKIKIKLKIKEKRLSLKVKDPGSGFNWEEYEIKAMPRLDEKGRGLRMINEVSDQVHFNSAGNEITASFKLLKKQVDY